MEKLVLIDGNSLINRAFYAMPLLTTKDGVYTNAVYGFTNMLVKILAEVKPDYLAVAFDMKAPTFRHKLYTDYKGTRKPMPEELRPQIPLLKEVLACMGIKTFEKEGIEADDIIGTVAKHTKVKTLIYTGDKDSFQLVDKETEVHFTKRGVNDTEIYDNDNFTEKTTISPYQIIELKALMGDSSDNIPGVSGIGEKTAYTLLHEYQTIENLYNHIDEITGKLKENLVNGKETCFLSKTLATINTDCDIDCDTEKMRVKLKFDNTVKQKFIALGFKSLSARDNLFEENGSVKESLALSCEKKAISLEEFNPDFTGDTCIHITSDYFCCYNNGVEYQIKINQTLLDDGAPLSAILEKTLPILEKDNLIVFCKKDLRHLYYDLLGINKPFTAQDVKLIKYLADFNGDETYEDIVPFPNGLFAFSLYNAYLELKDKLKTENAEKLYYDLELPLSDVLFDMEISGFKVDFNSLNQIGINYKEKLLALEKKANEFTDSPVNLNSPKQLGDLLFNKLKIAKGKKTKTGYSTSADVLESLDGLHPIIPVIIEYRKLQKLYSTYIEGLKPLIDRKTGLVHTCFNQTVTSTGRLSSKEPNLQNIPIREEEGRELRKLFVPKEENRIIIGADYSQIELRLLADFSKCESLIKHFNDGDDIHSQTASKVFGVEQSQVTPEMRRKAKAVNFGVIYGISEYGLAKNIKCSPKEAKEYIDAYFKEFPEIRKYLDNLVAFAKEKGYAKTILGRRRYIKELSSTNFALKSFGERAAMNMPLQGSSADIIKLAMLGVAKRLKEENLKSELILQIHDELIIDAVACEKEKVEKILTEEMENAVKLSVKLCVDVNSGKTWFEAK